MTRAAAEGIAIAGAGIAGLTAALAFAQQGFPVTIFEKAPKLEEAGAGLQLSPNATRLLQRLGAIESLGAAAIRPRALTLRKAEGLRPIARLPLGEEAERRWRAPYLVAHRADLQKALLEKVADHGGIELVTGLGIDGFTFEENAVRPAAAGRTTSAYRLLVGADGVWSSLRGRLSRHGRELFSGYVAWRALVDDAQLKSSGLSAAFDRAEVTALLDPFFHLVAYPVRGGRAVNLVVVTRGRELAQRWANAVAADGLADAMEWAHPALAQLARTAAWRAWPIYTAPDGPWTHPGGIALIGDAAHAMTPFAAQGAAMAIEDAVTLATLVGKPLAEIGEALSDYEKLRQARVRRVIGRGAFNRFVWHARGPVALGRDIVLRLRPGKSLMRDFDWLYGYDAETPARPAN
jgi:salicylate hydroxylase